MTNIGTKYIVAQKFIFDPYSNILLDQLNDNEVIRLGSNESRILLILIEQSANVVSRDQLHEYVWRDQGFQVDDSSLTQAISTLRKLLNDSTKSPQFIKTIPKRGYQLIATVEQYSVNDTSIKNEENQALETDRSAVDEHSKPISQQLDEGEKRLSKGTSSSLVKNWLGPAIWVLIILFPIIALMTKEPYSTQFTQIAMVDNIPLLQPENHPEIKSWLPAIERCTSIYLKQVKGLSTLEKVIATGNQNGQMTLNFIHSVDHSSQNQSVIIFSDQTNFSSVCQ